MDLKKLFVLKRQDTSTQFWNEASQKASEVGIPETTMYLCLLHICGMTSWDAWIIVCNHFEELTGFETLADTRAYAENQLSSVEAMTFKRWALARSEELYALDLQQYDWKFKDSEMELQYLIAASKETYRKTKTLTQTLSNTILNSVKELNEMHKYTGKGDESVNAKLVIFTGDSELME